MSLNNSHVVYYISVLVKGIAKWGVQNSASVSLAGGPRKFPRGGVVATEPK